MLNTTPVNSGLLSGGLVPYSATAQDMFVFDGYSLHNLTTRRVKNSDHDNLKNIKISTFDFPRQDGGGVLDKYYRERKITLDISLSASTQEELNTLIDDFKYKLSKTEGYLDIKINDIIRRWTATVEDIDFGRQYFNVTILQNVRVVFKVTDPHGFLEDNDSVSYYGITGDLNEEILYEGTASVFPIVYFIFGTGIANLEEVSIVAGNYTIGIEAITISDGDILIFDGETKSVTLNGTEVRYYGPFPELIKGGNPISFNFESGSTVSCDITVINKRKYL